MVTVPLRLVGLSLLILVMVGCASAGSTAPTPVVATEVAAATTAPEPTAFATPEPSTTAWWNNVVWYEIFVRSFQDSDGDGIGDFNGVVSKLDYLESLGVTGIWLMPIEQSPSYHGYDVVDYYTAEQDYGTNEDLKRLIEAAHARNMYVIVDHVINHTSSEHPWFIESKDPASDKRDWYIWADKAPSPNGWHTVPEGSYYGYFWEGMPDLNYRNPAVTAEIENATRFWLEDMGVDGLRMDAIKYLIEDDRSIENSPETHAWLQNFHTFIKGINPDAFAVGEVWSSSLIVAKYVPNEMDLAFEFDLATGMIKSAQQGRNRAVISAMRNTLSTFSDTYYATFLSNHDQPRVRTVVVSDAQSKTAATMLLMHPGVPFLYYGEEIGMQGTKPDENIRRPMQWNGEANGGFTTAAAPWHPFFKDLAERNVAQQEGDPASILNHYRALIALRNAHSAIRTGSYLPVTTGSDRVYAFMRQNEEETILVVINLGDEPASDVTLDLEESTLTSVTNATLLYGEGEVATPTLNADGGFTGYIPLAELAPTGSYIIQLTP